MTRRRMTGPYADPYLEIIQEIRAENTQLHVEIDRLVTILDDHGICPGHDCGQTRSTCDMRLERCCPDCTHREE